MNNLRLEIRKIINEQLDTVVDEGNLSNDLSFLSKFDFVSKDQNNGNQEFKFVNDVQDNKTVVKINQDPSGWSIDYDIIGYLRDQKSDFHLGPIESYEEFIKQCNNIINNNPLLSVDNNNDHRDEVSEQLVRDLVDQMISRKEEIYALPQGELEDLKKFCKMVEKLLSKKNVNDLMPFFYSKNKNLTGVINILNKVQNISYHKSMADGGFNAK